MKRRLGVASNIMLTVILIIVFTSFSVPAFAAGFSESFVAECEGEEWFLEFTKDELAKQGVSLSDDKTTVISALINVTEMTLQNKGIRKIPAAIKYFTGLKNVDLSFNFISDISNLYTLTGIETLILDGNFISSAKISSFPELTKLSMAYNAFTVSPVISSNKKLSHIDLSGNDIVNMPSLVGLNSLIYVNFSGNSIKDGSSAGGFAMKTGENYLDLSYNEIEDVSFLGNVKLLYAADLSNNKIKKGVNKIQDSIRSLDISHNYVSDASAFASLVLLENLDISYNSFSDINPLKTLTKLVSLNASHNKIKDVTELGYLTNLETVDMSYNLLEDMPFHSLLRKLKIFDISGNKITNIALINRYVNIEQLYAHDNAIENISSISGMTKLNVADFSNNKITDVSPELSKTTPSLDVIKLSGNPLSKDGVKNFFANGYSEVWLENIDLSGKMPDMKNNEDLWELYVSGSTLTGNDIDNIFNKTDYTGLGLGGLINQDIISKLKKQKDLIKLDVSSKTLSSGYVKSLASLNVLILDMSECGLTDAEDVLVNTNAMSVDLSGNKIKSVSLSSLETARANGVSADLSDNLICPDTGYLYYGYHGFDFSGNYTENNFIYTFSESGTTVDRETGKKYDFSEYVTAKNRYTNETVKLPTGAVMATVSNGIAEKLIITNGSEFVINEKIYQYENYEIIISTPLDRAFSFAVSLRTEIFPYFEITVSGATCITGIKPGTTFDEIYSNIYLASRYTFKAFDASGKELQSTENVATGNVIKVYVSGKEVLSRTVLIYGDVNGDGSIDDIDFLKMKRHLYEQQPLSGLYLTAADVQRSGTVDKYDLKLIMQYVLKETDITQ